MSDADHLDEMLRALALLGLVADGDYSPGDVARLLPDGTAREPGSPYLTLLAIGGVAIRVLAHEWGLTPVEAVAALRSQVLADLARGDAR